MSSETNSTLAIHSFEPRDVGEALMVARTLVASRLLPKAVQTPEAAFTIIMAGREMGLTAMQALRSIHIIEGKPTMSADLMLALTKRSPECEWFRLVQSTAEVATYECKRRGEPEPTRMSFTIAEARDAGLAGKDNWKKYPAAMLRARCIAALARAVFPDVMLGTYETDELTPAAPPMTVTATVVSADQSGEVGVADALLVRIAAASNLAELQAVSADVVEAVKLRRLSRDDKDRIAAAGKLRKAALAEAPPSAPDVTTTTDDRAAE